MDRHDYIENIMMFIRGITAINYQLQIKVILREYYRYKGKTYEMPDFYGGDDKNDGWVVEDATFFQIYAPTRLKDSLKKDIQDKFVDDLSGLLKIIYEDKKWNGDIGKFIFIVNTFDCNLPHDSEGFFKTKVEEYKKKYNIDFKYRVTNGDYLRDILYEINDINILEQISSQLRIRSIINPNAVTEKSMIDLIINISGNLNEIALSGKKEAAYDRISTIKKIEINNLLDKKDEIENIISQLDVVDNAVNYINQDIFSEGNFERVKDFVIKKYEELCLDFQGVELYEELIEQMLKYSKARWNLEVPMKFLIVYIFDKCDIFEKE